MKRKGNNVMRWGLAILVCVALAGCAGDGGKAGPDTGLKPEEPGELPPLDSNVVYTPDPDPVVSEPVAERSERITLEDAPLGLGDVVRRIGQVSTANFVVMNGIHQWPVGEFEPRRMQPDEAAVLLAEQARCALESTPHYYFFFPNGYEILLDISLAGRLHPDYAERDTDIAFGHSLPVFSAFQWMSYAMRINLVADNAVGEADLGELTLTDVPLEVALAAMLKSARVAGFEVESAQNYTFIYSPKNRNPKSALLNPDPSDPKLAARLDRRVSLFLPTIPASGHPITVTRSPQTLGSALEAISQQFGVPVVAEKGLQDLPVNPMALRNVRLSTAMDLLIRQWLIPEFGYQVTSDRIVIRSRQPGELVRKDGEPETVEVEQTAESAPGDASDPLNLNLDRQIKIGVE